MGWGECNEHHEYRAGAYLCPYIHSITGHTMDGLFSLAAALQPHLDLRERLDS